jgi:hypothetical protein
LSAVGSLTLTPQDSRTTVLLSWTPPFTLDIFNVNPDIAGYCVDVVGSSSAMLHSECGITVTEFTYPLPTMNWCDVYTFTVTPVNVVGNGTLSSLNYQEIQSKNLVILYVTMLTFYLNSNTRWSGHDNND